MSPREVVRKVIHIKCDNCRRALSAHSTKGACPLPDWQKKIKNPVHGLTVGGKGRGKSFEKTRFFKHIPGATILKCRVVRDPINNVAIFYDALPSSSILFTIPLDLSAKLSLPYDPCYVLIYVKSLEVFSADDIRFIKACARPWYGFYINPYTGKPYEA